MLKHSIGILFVLFCLFSVECSCANQDAYAYLDGLALKAGTDKSSAFHNYTKVYAKYFDTLRDEKLKFLEIGIFHGNSVKLWESYFVNSELHFIDIDPKMDRYQSKSSQYHFIDQANGVAMKNFVKSVGGNFDIIIDDGGHTMEQQIVSFKALFPAVNSGGLYIIEDVCTSYWQEYGGGGKIGAPAPGSNTCIEFLKGLIDDLNYASGVNMCADFDKVKPKLKGTLKYYQKHIESIHFYPSLCVIIKK